MWAVLKCAVVVLFFFKQKTADEMRISDWSSDVCSSDLTDKQKRDYLPRVASGELIMSFALTEPDAGSDAASLKTRAEPDGEDYVLNGVKRYITNAPRAGAFTLMARTGGPGEIGRAHV